MKALSKTIRFLFLFLIFTTPLIFTFFNSELFELPKMYFVYLLTLIIVSLHLINYFLGYTRLFQKNFLNLPLIIFLISQIICTFTSVDIHTSFFGYYSRLNGGLLSLICYFLLFFTLNNYLDKNFKSSFIQTALLSGLLVSTFGILEHFGIDKNIWVQDVQSRVFSTLGQPNWLAAYITILIPFSVHKFFNSPTKKLSIFYFLLSTIFYICLLFTKSKSGIIAAIISIFLYFTIKLLSDLKNKLLIKKLKSSALFLVFIILSLLISNPIKDKIFPQKLNTTNSILETNNHLNITPSEDIRKIVWKGALNLFQKYPIFGTGVETFAYSYYWTRPIEHNLTSEWDFLYNKAHNEYLNFLATTGLVGFTSYLLLIFSVLFINLKSYFKNHNQLALPIITSYISILITNAAGFSVVIVSLFFFLLPSFFNTPVSPTKKSLKFIKLLIIPTLLCSLLIGSKTISFYLADVLYAKTESLDNQDQYSAAYQEIMQSISLNPNEPNFLIKAGSLAAKLAITTKDNSFIDQSIKFSDQAIKISPANINFWKERSQNYFYLATIDSQYFQTTLNSMLQASKLAPTDAKIFFSIGQFLEAAELSSDAIPYYQKAVELKPNYDHAYFALGQIYFDQKKYDLAKQNLELNLKYAPTNTDAQDLLQKLPKIFK